MKNVRILKDRRQNRLRFAAGRLASARHPRALAARPGATVGSFSGAVLLSSR